LSFDVQESTHVNVVVNQFDMPLALDPLGLTAAQMAANPEQAGTNAVSRGVRKEVRQNQIGSALVHTIDTDRFVSARAYYGTRDNVQYQAGIPPATPTGAWVGLNRAYYGAGLQYNAQSRLGATPLTWVAGYEFDRSRETRQGGAAAVGVKTSTTRNEDNQAENSDFFAQATARVSDHVSVVAGLRYSTVRFSSDDDFLGDGNGSGATSFSAASPVLGLTYHASDSLNLYANYGKGFESPTLAEVAYSGAGVPAFNTSVNASSSQHYEVGAKWAPSPRSRLDFALFQIESKDEIVVASSTGGNSTFKNAPGTLRTGWELAGSTLLTPHVRAMVAASMVDATFSKTFTSGTTTVASGNKIPGIPQSFLFSELLWSSQKMDNSKKASALGSHAGIEFIQAGRLIANDVNTASANGYATFNMKASHSWAMDSGSLTTYARIDNLTDQRYVGSVIVNQASSQFYEPAPGKNWTLGLRLVLPL
jgi:iron complex outermembrane receptor protein